MCCIKSYSSVAKIKIPALVYSSRKVRRRGGPTHVFSNKFLYHTPFLQNLIQKGVTHIWLPFISNSQKELTHFSSVAKLWAKAFIILMYSLGFLSTSMEISRQYVTKSLISTHISHSHPPCHSKADRPFWCNELINNKPTLNYSLYNFLSVPSRSIIHPIFSFTNIVHELPSISIDMPVNES